MKKLVSLVVLLATLATVKSLPNCDPVQLRIYHGTNGLEISIRITNTWCCGIRMLELQCQQPNGQWYRVQTNRLAVCTDWTPAFTVQPTFPNAMFRIVQTP